MMHGLTGSREWIVAASLAMLVGWQVVGALPAQAAQAVLQKQVQVRYYTITGGDELTLLRDMRRKGPRVGGQQALASTRLQARYTANLEGRGNICSVRKLVIRARYTMTLPRLAANGKVRPTTRKRWPAFLARLRHHENRHVRIWQDCLQQVRRTLPGLTATSCSRLKLRLRNAYRHIMAQCSKRHDMFDRREKHAAASLPFIKAAFGLARRNHIRKVVRSSTARRAARSLAQRAPRTSGKRPGSTRNNWH